MQAGKLSSFSLCPTDAEFHELQELCRSSPLTDQPASAATGVDRQLYTSLLQLLACLCAPQLDVHARWDAGLKTAAVRRLEETGLRYDVATDTFSADDNKEMRIRRAAVRAPGCGSGVVPSTAGNGTGGAGVSDGPVPGGVGGKSAVTRGATAVALTLDDIQQVLSAANCPPPLPPTAAVVPTGGSADAAAADERALREITAYLQSEVGAAAAGKLPPPPDADMAGYDAAGGVARGALTNHAGGSAAGVVVRGVGDGRAGPASEPRANDVRPTDAGGGGTILVTDSNLPYLQQFLPNLQTVMQSVQSLVRCVPPSTTDSQQQQRSVSLPSLATCRATCRSHDVSSVDTHKRRKHATLGDVRAFARPPPNDFHAKPPDDLMEAKAEVDGAPVSAAPAAAAAGFACGLCSRSFSKRLGLSVHIQRAHGRRRSAESVSECPRDDAAVRNCVLRPAAAAPLLDAAADAGQSASVCMCDACGEIVSSLAAHAAVCAGRHSPTTTGHDATVAPAANTAVAEMLQLAEHFLRQHVPAVDKPASAPAGIEVMSPPPYSDADTRRVDQPTPGEFTAADPPLASAVVQPAAGKEIVYEGSRMREFVEYQCEACLLTFGSGALANAHVADHHAAASVSAYRVYACVACSLRYRDPRIMRHHVVYLCGGARPPAAKHPLFPCAYCAKTFMSPEYMQLHVRLRHTAAAAHSVATPVQCVLPTPPGAASVPSLDQLVSQFRRHPGAASAHVPVSQTTHAPAVGAVSSGGQPSSANHSDSLADHSKARPVGGSDEDGAGTLGGQSQPVVDGRHCQTDAATGKSRSSKAKGILYKNVFMQCEGTYYCAVCRADLTGRESKRRHRQLACGDPKTAAYSRRYSYVCPYCSERFPSQKACRQHQLDECLPLIGVGSAELGAGQQRCPICPKACCGSAALRGHLMQLHRLPSEEATRLMAAATDHVRATCVAAAVPEFNGVLSPAAAAAVSSPSSSSTRLTQTTAAASPAAVHSASEPASLHADALDESEDDDLPDTAADQPRELITPLDPAESVASDDCSQPTAGAADDAMRPKQRSGRKARARDEFFVMMFRNYPILAKGVSMCRSCAAQLEPSATAESHAAACSGTAAVDVRRSTLFRCTHCTATFWRAKDCRSHQLESCLPAHGVEVRRLSEPSVACPLCAARSYNRSGLMSHMKFRHALDTRGVRAMMDRCGIRKSVVPATAAADHVVAAATAPASPAGSPELDENDDDGSLSMDDAAVQCGVAAACDGVVTGAAAAAAADMTLVDCIADDLPLTTCADNAGTDSWRTAGMVLQRSSADLCTNLS